MKKRVTSRPVRPQIFISVDPTGPAPVCVPPLSLSPEHERQQEERPNASLHTLVRGIRPSRITVARISVISRGEEKRDTPHRARIVCVTRLSYDWPRQTDHVVHACTPLSPFLFCARYTPSPLLVHLAGISVPLRDSKLEGKRAFHLLSVEATRHFVHGPPRICHLPFRRDGWIRETVVLSTIFIYFFSFFTWKEYLITWCTNDLVSWNLIVILFNYCNCNLGRGGVNFWTFLKFRKNFFFIRVILSWQDKSIIFRGGKKGKNPLNSL